MNTQDYIESIKQKNLEKAKWVLKMRFEADLNKFKEFYADRPSEYSWADLKTVIEVLEEHESNKQTLCTSRNNNTEYSWDYRWVDYLEVV